VTSANGERRILYWILGTLASLALAGSTGAATHALSRVGRLEADATGKAERLRAVEVQWENVGGRLERIEKKIDLLTTSVGK